MDEEELKFGHSELYHQEKKITDSILSVLEKFDICFEKESCYVT